LFVFKWTTSYSVVLCYAPLFSTHLFFWWKHSSKWFGVILWLSFGSDDKYEANGYWVSYSPVPTGVNSFPFSISSQQIFTKSVLVVVDTYTSQWATHPSSVLKSTGSCWLRWITSFASMRGQLSYLIRINGLILFKPSSLAFLM
jgi:hypothetical protein